MKRFSLDQFIWFLVLLGILVSTGALFFTGKMFLLVSEKVKIYTAITLLFLFIILMIQVTRVFSVPSRGGIKKGYIFYIVLIFSFFIVFKIDVVKSSLIMKGVIIEHKGHNHGHEHGHNILISEDTILVGKDNFHSTIEAINEEPEKYSNKKIRIEGLLYKENIQYGDFILTQIDMNCCMVDSDYLGIICTGKMNDSFDTGNDVTVNGIIKVIEVNGKKLGAIDVRDINK